MRCVKWSVRVIATNPFGSNCHSTSMALFASRSLSPCREALAWSVKAVVEGIVCGRAAQGNQMREVRQSKRAQRVLEDLRFLLEGECGLILMVGNTGGRS